MAKKIKETKEEQQVKLLAMRLEELRKGFIPEPNRSFEVGEEVKHGAIDFSEVADVLDDGKIYLLNQRLVKKGRFGAEEDVTEHRQIYVAWTEVRPYRTAEQEDAIPVQVVEEKIRFQSLQTHLRHILLVAYGYGLEMDQDYQRGNVWTEKQKQDLIESIFNNISIGSIAVVKRIFSTEKKLTEVVDGKQRCTAIIEFYEDRFRWRGRLFSELNYIDQSHFENYSISWLEVDEEYVPSGDAWKYEYFLKLNTGGSPQDPRHLEKVRKLWEEAKEKEEKEVR